MISLRAYARHRGVAPSSVVVAVQSGRLRLSVVRDGKGRPKIADVALADREWEWRPRTDRISLRAYARHRGVAPSSVVAAVQSGRLMASVVRDAKGRPKIANVALADVEWAAAAGRLKAAS